METPAKKLRVVITRPNQNTYSETFIRNHIRHLPCEVFPLWGKWVPRASDMGDSFGWAPLLYLEDRFNDFTGRSLSLFRRRRLKAYLRKVRPDVVLAEYGLGGAAMAPICEELGIPLVAYFLGLDGYGYKILERWGAQYRRLFRSASGVVAVSRDMKAQLVALGCPEEKIQWVVCGVDGMFFERPLDLSPREPVFLAVGRFVAKKSPLLLLRSFAGVLESVPQARLITYGDGPLWQDARKLAEELGVARAVEFRGKGKPEAIAEVMEHALAFVQHSVRAENGDSEGTPVAILEASACGLPIVSTLHAGIKDTVAHGETGLLVPENDEKAFADAMIRLARDPELAMRMGVAGRAHVQKNFSIEKTISDLYQVLLRASGTSKTA